MPWYTLVGGMAAFGFGWYWSRRAYAHLSREGEANRLKVRLLGMGVPPLFHRGRLGLP